MGLSKAYSAQVSLLNAHIVSVEADIARGLYQFGVVGLPDKAVEESRDRVGAAVKNSGFSAPKQKNQKITISLAPAELKKEGPAFDLPIALSYLLASKEISFNPEKKLFVGELSLSGDVRGVRGALSIAKEARARGFEELYVPEENAEEAALVEGINVFGVTTLRALAEHFKNDPKSKKIGEKPTTKIIYDKTEAQLDFQDIKGQTFAKQGLLIAAAGGHNVGMYGPPGTGKTMLARAFSGILPQLSEEEVFEVSSIYSVAGLLEKGLVTLPPFRAPHHTSSYVSLVGGGTIPRPGEITLAHRGVLFLDEFPEFDKRVIESLRQPLEDGKISIARAKGSAIFPARVTLIASMNPCPCGFYESNMRRCVCSPQDLSRYRRKLSGPIVDRIDLWLSVDGVEYKTLSERAGSGAKSEDMRERVAQARAKQKTRFASLGRKIRMNSEMSARDLVMTINLTPPVKKILEQGAERLKLSARGYHKMMKLARTIADLDDKDEIEESHALEAFQYRPKENYF
ncbi:MAG: YifB family Mg chelatase-like AAA ATPase [Patescibacteria group bacterium]